MQSRNATQHYQSALAGYCRTGMLENIPGVVQENVPQYRRLVLNVIDDMLQNAYPLTYDLLKETEWNAIVHDFFSNHPCQSPQVWYMPREFYQYLTETAHPILTTYSFLKELLWFEWIEVELFMMEDQRVPATANGALQTDKLVLNPEHSLLTFEYPVHQKNPKKISNADKRHYFVVAHRNSNGEVIFTDVTAALMRMVEYLAEAPYTTTELFSLFETEYGLQLSETDKEAILNFLKTALQQELIAGFAK
ncbi:MAG: putative DNA-binding domain-containing protein [Niabella sp.]|nr:putative DNA-binding domain-containing protein [Niabella sp.]